MNRSQFGVDGYGSFGSGEMQNLPFPIGTIPGPYHCSATALARDINMYLLYTQMNRVHNMRDEEKRLAFRLHVM